MRAGGGRAKGANFERVVAKAVIRSFARFGITIKDCYRTPMSGGHPAASLTSPGDLVVSARLAKLFPFSVECKRVEALSLDQLFQTGTTTGLLQKFMQQAVRQAGQEWIPLLVVKKNHGPLLAVLPVGEWGVVNRSEWGRGLAKIRPQMLFRFAGADWTTVSLQKLLILLSKER